MASRLSEPLMKMKRSLSRFPASLIAPAALALLSAFASGGGASVQGGDSLAREFERWTRFVRENTATDEFWTQAKEGAEAALLRS